MRALDHEEPDRVPLVFGVATPGFEDAWLRQHEDDVADDDIVYFYGHDLTMAKQMGFDAAWAWMPLGSLQTPDTDAFGTRLPRLNPGQFITSEGRVQERSVLGGKAIEWYVGPGLPSMALWLDWFEHATFKPPSHEEITSVARQYTDAINGPKGGLLPLITTGSILETIMEGMGFAAFARACRKDRPSLERALDMILDIRLSQANAIIDAGVRVVIIADDSAYKDRTYIPADLHREIIVPRYAKLAKKYHDAGIKFLLHSDGFTEPYFPGFIEAGIDGIVTIETAAGMDLGRLKQAYGADLSLIAPVDCSRLLSFGSRAEIERAVIDLIHQGAADGGFAMGPCTSFLDTIPLENARCLVDATMKHGKYPIHSP